MWYFFHQGRQLGPLDEEQLREHAEQGALTAATPLRQHGKTSFTPAGELFPDFPWDPQAGFTFTARRASAAAEKDYLLLSILATLFCCIPPGTVAIVYSLKANTARDRGDDVVAHQAAITARNWLLIAAVTGFLPALIVAFYAVMFFLSTMAGALG